MKELTDLEYLKLSKWNKFVYKLKLFFCGIPGWFVSIGKAIGAFFKKLGLGIADNFVDLFNTFKNGSWKTRVSFLIMGFGSIMFGQWLRGVLFLAFEAVFIVYMVLFGAGQLAKFGNLGDVEAQKIIDPIYEEEITIPGDNSFNILLYGLLAIIFIIALVYTWRLNVKQCRICEEIIASGKKIKSGKDDLKSLLDDQFHKTLLALPLLGIAIFTVIPIIFMILVAFTNYDKVHMPLFDWVGGANFAQLFELGNGNQFAMTFGEILLWTLIWSVFATFTTYFLGMLVAMLINKKGIRFKKVWRTVLVLTIAIPQFISLLYVSNLFEENGFVNKVLMDWGWIQEPVKFWTGEPITSRVTVILINIWIGIPYLMLITTGILMNIPEDLYESAKIDGANAFQQFFRITLPYMLFVTGPFLLTSFINNLNNFNVIYLLTGGRPVNPAYNIGGASSTVGSTDLLVTWLFKLTGDTGDYKLASVIGIMVFLIVAFISLIVFNLMPSNKNEEEFS